MIAVFGKYPADFKILGLSPVNKFIWIQDVSTISRCNFEAAIFLPEWSLNDQLVESYLLLKQRQPELFEFKNE